MSNIDPITFYTMDTDNCTNLKILMDPIVTLKHMAIKNNNDNPYNDEAIELLKSQNISINEEELNNLNKNIIEKEYIKDIKTLDTYISNLEYILRKAYINYYNFDKLPDKLYRSIGENELEFLNKPRTINTLFSTTKDLKTCKDFTIETSNSEWEPQEHSIIELLIKGRIPFIDVDKDSKTIYEPNEIILVNPFTITKPTLTKKGGLDINGFYNYDNISMYSATISNIENNPTNIDIEKLLELYETICNEIHVYGNKIEQYINNNIGNELFEDTGYIEWANKLTKMINMLQTYINYCILKDIEPKTLVKRK